VPVLARALLAQRVDLGTAAGEDVATHALEVSPPYSPCLRPALRGRLRLPVEDESVRPIGVQAPILDDRLDRVSAHVSDPGAERNDVVVEAEPGLARPQRRLYADEVSVLDALEVHANGAVATFDRH